MKIYLLFILLIQCYANENEDPEWFSDVVPIRARLIEGKNIRLRNALPKYLLDFDFNNIKWEQRIGKNEYGKEWFSRHECEECADQITDYIHDHLDIFNMLIPLKNATRVVLALTKYQKGDYLELHNDYNFGTRVLSFVLHLNRINPKCGGDFIWVGERGIKKARPLENTLYLFIPTSESFHMIETVHCEERYAISGWFYSDD